MPLFRIVLLGLAIAIGYAVFAALAGVQLGLVPAYGFVLVLGGVVWTLGAITDWRWFWTAGGAQRITSLFGRAGARVFFALLGGAVTGIGLAILGAPRPDILA